MVLLMRPEKPRICGTAGVPDNDTFLLKSHKQQTKASVTQLLRQRWRLDMTEPISIGFWLMNPYQEILFYILLMWKLWTVHDMLH